MCVLWSVCNSVCCLDVLYLTAIGPGSTLGRSVPHQNFWVRNDWLGGQGRNQRRMGGALDGMGRALWPRGGVLRFGWVRVELFLLAFFCTVVFCRRSSLKLVQRNKETHELKHLQDLKMLSLKISWCSQQVINIRSSRIVCYIRMYRLFW